MDLEMDVLRRLDAIERKLDLLLDRFDVRVDRYDVRDEDDTWLPEVVDLVQRGRKIQAIKVFREMTGAGLREARDAVEAMEAGRLPR